MNDVRLAAVMMAVEARYPGTRCVVEPWTDPDGDPDTRWWLCVLNVRPKDAGPLHDIAIRIALDLYGPDPLPFTMSVEGRRNTRLFLARKAAEARRGRARLRRAEDRTRAARTRAGGRPARVRSA